MNIFSKYPGYDPFTKVSTNIWTELAWAFSEAGVGSLAVAQQHIEKAKALLRGLPHSPGADMLNAQVSQAAAQLARGEPISSPVAGSQLGVAPLPGAK